MFDVPNHPLEQDVKRDASQEHRRGAVSEPAAPQQGEMHTHGWGCSPIVCLSLGR